MNINTTPLLINKSEVVEKLERIDFADNLIYNESWLQSLIFNNIELFPVYEINPDFTNLIPVCMELRTESGRIDCLYVTTTGRLVIVEVKLYRNQQSRREVLAQTLDYAKDLNKWTYSDLDSQVKSRTNGKSLFECVKEHNDAVPEAGFVDAVQRSLTSGKFLLMVVGDGIREEANDIKEFLTRNGSLEFTFALLEMMIFRMSNDTFLVQPNLLLKTEIVERHVISIKTDSEKIITSVNEDVVTEEFSSNTSSNSEPSEMQSQNLNFWERFLSGLTLDDKTQPYGNPSRTSSVSFSLPPSGSVAWVTVYKEKKSNSAGIFVRFSNTEKGEYLYSFLKNKKGTLDEYLLEEITWSDEGRKILIEPISFDFSDESSWERAFEYYSYNLNKLVSNFRPLLQRLSEKL